MVAETPTAANAPAAGSTAGEGLSEAVYEEYMSDEGKIPKLTGKVIAITGTTTGLGFCLARAAIAKDARVIMMLNRSSARSAKAEEDLTQLKVEGSDTEVITVPCDLQNLSSISETASKVNEIAKQHGGLDVLCFNAGIMMMSDTRTKDGFEVQMQTNQLSHALLMKLVWESLESAAAEKGEARVVFQSSSARAASRNGNLQARFFEKSEPMTLGGDNAWFLSQAFGFSDGPSTRYHHSKLANSAFGMALHHKLQEKKSTIKALVCEPGYSITPLQTTSHFLPGWLNYFPISCQSPADGCLNAAMCCFSPEANSGDFYAPEKGLVGPPKKIIAAGVPVVDGSEKLTCDPENHKTAWEACEKALDIEFEV